MTEDTIALKSCDFTGVISVDREIYDLDQIDYQVSSNIYLTLLGIRYNYKLCPLELLKALSNISFNPVEEENYVILSLLISGISLSVKRAENSLIFKNVIDDRDLVVPLTILGGYAKSVISYCRSNIAVSEECVRATIFRVIGQLELDIAHVIRSVGD